MTLLQKINFHLLKLLRMSWFMLRYSLNKWKKIDGIFIPVQMQYGYSIVRFINNGEYEQGEINIIKNTLQKNDVVLELGTGIGFVSAYCARQVGNEQVHTFEANSSLESSIQSLYKKNRVHPQLTFAILGENAGTKTFYRDTGNFLASSAIKNEDATQEMTQITVLNLNETIKKIQPTYLMMDIEGGEYDIFNIIHFYTIEKIQFELHPAVLGNEKVEAIFRQLHQNNFSADKTFSSGNNFYFKKTGSSPRL
jgi:FkbM family methyltransferase